MMRKFLLKVLIFAAYASVLSVTISVLIDPFNVFHALNIRPNGVDPNKNYIKMKYILANPEKFDSFMFGSSRVGLIHTGNITGENCYNMTCPYSLLGWNLLNIKTFLKNGVRPKKIYIGLDENSYKEDYQKQIDDPKCCPYEYLCDDMFHFIKLYCNASAAVKSLSYKFKTHHGKTEIIVPEIFYEYGYGFGSGCETNFNWRHMKLGISQKNYDPQPSIDSGLRYVSEICELCRKNGIELILFTHPMYYKYYTASIRNNEYFRFLESLAEIMPFWNFCSLNDITMSNANYYDPAHYNIEVGDILINVMCYGKSYPELQAQGFGVKVTRENSKDFISMLRKQFEDYERSHK